MQNQIQEGDVADLGASHDDVRGSTRRFGSRLFEVKDQATSTGDTAPPVSLSGKVTITARPI
jgi:hypothetical protein